MNATICGFCLHPFSTVAITPAAITRGEPVREGWVVTCPICGARYEIYRIVTNGPTISAEELAQKRNINR